MHRLIVFIYGPPGSGKGTNAHYLAQRFNMCYVGAGDIFRSHPETKSYTLTGNFVPMDKARNALQEFFSKIDKNKHLVLDGIPRVAWQIDLLQELHALPNCIFHLLLSDNMCRYRIQNRYIDPYSGAIYQEKTQHNLIQREDDLNEEVINRRLELYHINEQEIISILSKKHVIHKIDAQESVDSIQKKISSIVEKSIHEKAS